MLKPGGRLVIVDSLQRGDQPDYDGLLELFPKNYHEPYYSSYTREYFSALATNCGLPPIRHVKAFVSKVMVFDKLDCMAKPRHSRVATAKRRRLSG